MFIYEVINLKHAHRHQKIRNLINFRRSSLKMKSMILHNIYTGVHPKTFSESIKLLISNKSMSFVKYPCFFKSN